MEHTSGTGTLNKCNKCRAVYEGNICPVCDGKGIGLHKYLSPVVCESCGVQMEGTIDMNRGKYWFICPECGRFEQ